MIEKKMINRNSKVLKGLLLYTLLWLGPALGLLIVYLIKGKSFLWTPDGINQHYQSFCYLCEAAERIFEGKSPGGFYRFTLGQGLDVFTTLNSYDYTDPISILCSLIAPLSRITRYYLMIFAKLYAMGISFLVYCKITKRKMLPSVMGAIIFVFSGSILWMALRHPNFTSGEILLPLLLAGVELYKRERKKWLLLASIVINVLANFYVFYINAIFVAIYVIVFAISRMLEDRKPECIRNEIRTSFKILGICFLGVLLSSFALFPTIYSFLNQNRVAEATGYQKLWYYPIRYYGYIFSSIFSPVLKVPYTSILCLNVSILIPVLILFFKEKRKIPYKILFIIPLIIIAIPLLGRIMNGFGYPSNRMTYVIPFFVSLIFVSEIDKIATLSWKDKLLFSVLIGGYVGIVLIGTLRYSVSKAIFMTVILILVYAIAILLLGKKRDGKTCYGIIMMFVIIGAFFQSVGMPYFYMRSYLDSDSVSDISSRRSIYGAPVDENEFYRVESREKETNNNQLFNLKTTDFWWSFIPSSMMDYHLILGASHINVNCMIYDLDARAPLLALANVKYYTSFNSSDDLIPYGFSEYDSSYDNIRVYENDYSLPLGYTYQDTMLLEDFMNLDPISMEQAMLQAAVVDSEIQNIDTIIPNNYQIDLQGVITDSHGVTIGDNEFEVTSKDNGIAYSVDVPEGCELYLLFDNLSLSGPNNSIRFNIKRQTDSYKVNNYTRLFTREYMWPSFQEDFVINLGGGYEGESAINLSFADKGTFSYNSMRFVAIPMDYYEECITTLSEEVLQDVEVRDDYISGTINLSSRKLLQFSIPYSDGWTIYIDGKKGELIKSNIMYMAAPIDKGEHKIELKYRTPYLLCGSICSIVSLVGIISYDIVLRKRRRKSWT